MNAVSRSKDASPIVSATELADYLGVKRSLMKCIFKKDHAYLMVENPIKVNGQNYLTLEQVIQVTAFFTCKKIMADMRSRVESICSN